VGSSTARISSRRSGEEQPHIGKYRLLKTIGKGNFAKVKLAKHIPTGKEVSNPLHNLEGGFTIIFAYTVSCGIFNQLFILIAFLINCLFQVAIKIIDKTQLNPSSLQKVWRTMSTRFHLNSITFSKSALPRSSDNEDIRPPEHREAVPSDRD
jgi:serine/threonine protein kinase